MIRLRRWISAAALLGFAVAGNAAAAAAQDAGAVAPDSLEGFLRSLSDSTDAYFGTSGAPVDTAGLDSSLAHRLTQPWLKERRRLRVAPGPWLNFNRADGPLMGGSLALGRARGWGELQGRLATVTGPNELRGGGRYRREWASKDEDDPPSLALQVEAGRFTERLDSDRRETSSYVLWILLSGDDNQSYLRRDGTRIHVTRDASTWRAEMAFRTQLETPLTTTATWSLFGPELDLVQNFPATSGRAQELSGTVAFRLPRLPAGVAVEGRWSDDALGSDFDYRRLRVTAGADVPLGQVVSLVPELEYARLQGEALPQNSFFMGGTRSLRSLEPNLHAGTGRTFARLDAIFVPDLLALARLPHPALFPIQGGVFTATGAVWGRDVFRGAGSGENRWPDPDGWRSEAGLSLLYRPGIPDPSLFLRGDVAFPVGPGHETRFLLYFHTALDQIPLGGRGSR